MNGEVNNSVDSDMPGGDEAVVQSRLIDRDVLHACVGVLVDFAGEALCQNLQLEGTRGAIEAIADALRGGLAGDSLLVSGAAAAKFSPSSTAVAVSLHCAYARAAQAESAAEMSSLVRIASALADFLCVTLLQHRRYLDIIRVHSDRVTAAYPSGVISQDQAASEGFGREESHECSGMSAALKEAAVSGELFPGLPACRPGVDTSSCAKDDRNNCSKVYVVPKAHSQGLIIVVCVCRHPKVIGVFVLPSAESLSIVASVLLTRFGVLPDVVFYDAACLLCYSISLRFPSLLSRTIFVTDRFHEEGHTCGPIYSARFRPEADGMRSSNAESINAIFASSRNHLRYLGEHHLMPFLFVKMLNGRVLLFWIVTLEYTLILFFSTHPYISSLLLVVEGGGKEGRLKLSSIATSARSRFAARR
jgi:hypothetical protein